MSRTLQLIVAYDGTDFSGFQRLARGRSVQGTLEAAWREATGEAVRTVGAGRTDAGVHALGQCVSLVTESGLPADRVPAALNGKLAPDVRIRWAREREETFHARFSARRRTYRYLVRRRGRPSVFLDRFSLLDNADLDLGGMREAAERLLGHRDYRSFGSPEPGRHGVRDVRRITLREHGGWLIISLTANAFLKGMARTLAARILAVGHGDDTPDGVEERLNAMERRAGGKGLPPQGLYLARVDYDITGSAQRTGG